MIKHAIVLVPFPFDDFSATKVRPAICLTNCVGDYQHVIIAFISSQIPDAPIDSDVIVKRNTPCSAGTGLSVDSVIRLHKVVTIPKYLILRRLGEANPKLQDLVVQGVKQLFELE